MKGNPAAGIGGSWPTHEQRLLLVAALSPSQSAIDAWQEWHSAGHLDKTDEGSFRLLPLAYHNLAALGFDDPVMQVLKGVFRRAWAANQQLLRDLLPLVARWESQGTRTLLLKGPALAARYYPNLGLRPMRDVDVLVPSAAEAHALIESLRGAGWVLHTWMPTRVRPAYWGFRHSVSLVNTKGQEIDIHWHALYRCGRQSIDDGFWGRAVPLDVMGVSTRALDPTDQLLLACTHGPEFNEVPPLRWIADAMTILRSGHVIEWDRFADFVETTRLTLPTVDALALLRQLLHAPVPDEVMSRIEAIPISRLERLEYARVIDTETLQPAFHALAAHYGQYRRAIDGKLSPRVLGGFARYMQYFWELESLSSLAPRCASWLWMRAAGSVGGAGRVVGSTPVTAGEAPR